jgi:hypothetical protein
MEKIVLKRLSWFLNDKNLFDNNQNRFRPGRNTIDNAIKLQYSILDGFTQHKETTCVFFDIVKAFDRVPHETVIESLIK